MKNDLNHRQRDIGIVFEWQRSGALSRSELATRLGCSANDISQRLRVLKAALPDLVSRCAHLFDATGGIVHVQYEA